MSELLFWLSLPLLLVPWAACDDRRGAAAGQLIIAGLGLAALHQGVGTLDPRDLHDLVARSGSDAWFIGLTAGFMISGGCLFPDPRRWVRVVLGVPLIAALLFAVLPQGTVALLTGALIGVLPWLAGRFLLSRGWVRGRRGESDVVADAVPAPLTHPLLRLDRRVPSLLLATLVMIAARFGPIVVALVALVALVWREWWLNADTAAPRPLPFLPLLASLALGVWGWLAMTIAGSPGTSLWAFGSTAPVSDAASEWLAVIAIAWMIAMLPPWPIRQLFRSRILPVVAVAVVELAVTRGSSSGLDHWQPLLTLCLVVAAIGASIRRHPDGLAAALVLLAATRAGPMSVIAASLAALIPIGRRLVRPGRAYSVYVGVTGAMIVASVLRDQVLLAVMLGMVLASAANALDHVVAGPS
ncbi:MAG TPA: hypothetical protein VGM20_09425 [Gemmatimonadales bacterium]|jgi:hypothetical protein